MGDLLSETYDGKPAGDVIIAKRGDDESVVICGMARKKEKLKSDADAKAEAEADAELIACYKMYDGDDPKTFTAYTIELERIRLARKK